MPGTGIGYKSLGQEARRSPLTRLNEKAKKRRCQNGLSMSRLRHGLGFINAINGWSMVNADTRSGTERSGGHESAVALG